MSYLDDPLSICVRTGGLDKCRHRSNVPYRTVLNAESVGRGVAIVEWIDNGSARSSGSHQAVLRCTA